MRDVGREGLPNYWCPGFAGEKLDRLAVLKSGPGMCEETQPPAQALSVVFSKFAEAEYRLSRVTPSEPFLAIFRPQADV